MRAILHCDLNNFFASVEMLTKPELRNVPMAVSGDPNKRHGIILAKNQIARKYGIYTPETVYSALRKCPKLVLVKPHYEEYVKYSKLVNKIYQKYTDRVEKFSIDESFLDVTESISIFGTPYEIAYKIKEEVKSKYNLTISVGVSFNKTFAKLGSDLKKPDAITVLDYENYKEKIYDLPVNMLLYVGKNTKSKLNKLGIKTIGDLALSNKYRIVKHLGKFGEQIHNHANGIDDDPVKYYYEKEERKSISKGITFESDISDIIVVEKEFVKLTSDVAFTLRKNNMKASVVSIVFKDAMFVSSSRQKKINFTNSFDEIFVRQTEPKTTPIEKRLKALKELHKKGIYTILSISPIFPYITDFEEIVEKTRGYVDEYWFENLNLRQPYKLNVLNYIYLYYPELDKKYTDIYIKKDPQYWFFLRHKIIKYCRKHKLTYKIDFRYS